MDAGLHIFKFGSLSFRDASGVAVLAVLGVGIDHFQFDGRDRHVAERRLVHGKPLVECIVRDVSATGAKLELREDMALPAHFLLALTKDGSVRRPCQTVWQFSVVAGVRFG